MIFDHIDHIDTYAALPGIKAIAEYLKETDLSALEPGTYEIDGRNLYVMIQEPTQKKLEEARPEAHDVYADLQLVIKGCEYMGYAPRAIMGEPVEVRDGKDICFYEGKFSRILANEGDFAVFFPQDAHAPNIGDPAAYEKKAVFKIKLN
jgi:biofilm protein TabA